MALSRGTNVLFSSALLEKVFLGGDHKKGGLFSPPLSPSTGSDGEAGDVVFAHCPVVSDIEGHRRELWVGPGDEDDDNGLIFRWDVLTVCCAVGGYELHSFSPFRAGLPDF